MNKMNATLNRVKTSWTFVMAFMLMAFMASCGGNGDDAGNANMISGGSSKTWKADKELTASGDKDKLTQEEKQETMQFYSDGRFAMGGGGSLETGTWTYDQAGRRLSLTFEGSDVSQNFTVEKLTDKEMHLVGGDGSKMELKAD
ncbi:lipocalin family protein [Pontibacter sp. FD36]|uniref:lipocalin family protein n=1 Tax=Pontibacter sp. FD36 TaxID=2789860 RepID=UPI0018A981D2|nr:lipocalin family protein [Pontibacter sp. FD36]MBF8964862.1 lipocalin family protein [Pontibacter sp. FD36]